MNEIGEALGTAAEGALYGRAVEPKRGEAAADGHTHESTCLNCGTVLIGPHCHACGQRAHVHRTIGAFLHDCSTARCTSRARPSAPCPCSPGSPAS